MNKINKRTYTQNEVAYCTYLHLDTLDEGVPHELLEKHKVYKIEGKDRPCIFVGDAPIRRNGRDWYRVVRVTTRTNAAGGALKGHIPIGEAIEEGKCSYASRFVLEIPDNFIVRDIAVRDKRVIREFVEFFVIGRST